MNQLLPKNQRIVANWYLEVLHHPEEYDEGVIFSTATHEHHYNQKTQQFGNPDQSMTRLGVVNSKFRKFVAVRRFANHVIAL
jgi:hypothetical protein